MRRTPVQTRFLVVLEYRVAHRNHLRKPNELCPNSLAPIDSNCFSISSRIGKEINYDIDIPLPVSHQNLKEERQESENLNEVCLPMTTTLSQIATTLEGRPVRAPLGSHISPVRSAPKRTKTHNCFRPRLTFSSMIPLRLRV